MKRFLLGALGAVAMLGPAAAADLAARPYTKAPAIVAAAYDWSGFYVGLNGGWGSSRKCWDEYSATDILIGSDGCHDATGGVAGGQIGYRWQISSFVFGVEAQGDWANLRGSNVDLITPAFTNRSRIDAFGLFTGQIGFAVNNALLYVKGGAAVTADRFDIYTSANAVPPNTLVANTADQTRWGATVGAGLEYGFAPNWSAAIEYDHLFMGTRSGTFLTTAPLFAPGVFFSNERIRQDVDLVTVRINYHWGSPVVAKY